MPTDKRFTMSPHRPSLGRLYTSTSIVCQAPITRCSARCGKLARAPEAATSCAALCVHARPLRLSRLTSRPKPSRSVDKVRRQIAQTRLCPILVGYDSLRAGQWPGDAEVGIVPRQAPIALGRVKIRHLVEHLGLGLESTKAVRKPFRDPNLRPVVDTEGCR